MMRLRTRILCGYAFIVVVLIVGGFFTAHIQHRHLMDALDQRIERLVQAPKFIEKRTETNRLGKPAGAGLSDTYLGVVAPAGSSVRTLAAPDDDPSFVPDITNLNPGQSPKTVNAAAGSTERARASAIKLSNKSVGIVAIPLTSTDKALSRLNTTLLLVALITFVAISVLTCWILLLGIKPIRSLSAAAEQVSKGKSPDVSAVRTPSREASELQEAINALIVATKANEDAMRRFVADASHELRTPLTTLRGYASLLTGSNATDPVVLSDSLSRISEESLRMSRLVDDLFTLARSEEEAPLEISRFDLADLIRDLVSDLRVAQPARDISSTGPNNLELSADRLLITQAILALATNALRHTAGSASVAITHSRTSTGVRVEVSDTGQGIEAEHIPHLFDRFYRANTGGALAGSGLGLAIVASIVERHDGRVGVDSTVGIGSTFWIEIPDPSTSGR
jgi:two-component system, OmpR family, sensor kinase